uniref:Uncharacterized protein n=1 Tax=Romanomermis culicivorax TaxID=13658 RepID=A0A915J703_ROMCU
MERQLYEENSPFTNYPKFSLLEKLQIIVMTVFVFPTRIALCVSFTILAFFVCRLALLGLDYPAKPLMGIRLSYAPFLRITDMDALKWTFWEGALVDFKLSWKSQHGELYPAMKKPFWGFMKHLCQMMENAALDDTHDYK